MELAHEDFKTAITNMFRYLKDNMNLMRIKCKIQEKRTKCYSGSENCNIWNENSMDCISSRLRHYGRKEKHSELEDINRNYTNGST